MENRRPWNRNAPSSAASFSRSQRPRGQKFPANATQNPKPRNFSERRTPTAAYVSNSGLDRNLNSRKLPRDEEVHVEGPSYSGSLVGTCPHMCPERERIQREQLRDLAVFERLNGNHGKSSPDLAVKKVKFHVISHYKLRSCMGNPIIASMHHLNMEQLTKTLTSLFGLYDANQSSNNLSENEAEFRSLYVLLHLGSCSKPTEDSLSLWFGRLSTSVLKSKEMCFARRILRSFRIGNYKHFLCTTAAQVSYLQYCIVEPYINEVRVLALACINFGGYKLHPYPLLDLSVLLRMKESDLESICNACGLEIRTDEAGNKVLPTKQTTFCHPKGEFQRYTFLGLEEFER
ncbi:SAC3 family protein C-like isoform X2 [Prosopis cineraria]|uniref:SAC3 family protein C-like isoform X2 n=1 Tax=Prosopis cineraria TaxID=364024 RepID=UPI002410AB98|nr:SAC3 family protein C-like isoform X2 [Prosopis cineraria]XP_054813871.1 SAC3 family protein C-like isoform X2 [Prosopis cineraria]